MKKLFLKNDFYNDFFINNVWLLDDKYMFYIIILSDLKMIDLLNYFFIEEEEILKDDSRLDIVIVFFDNLDNLLKVDVVIVELKKINLKLVKKEEVIS